MSKPHLQWWHIKCSHREIFYTFNENSSQWTPHVRVNGPPPRGGGGLPRGGKLGNGSKRLGKRLYW